MLLVYRQLYAPNPFSSAASEEDLKQYLRDLEEFKSKSITSQLDKAPLAAPETPTTNGAAASNGQQQNSEVVQQTNSSSPLNNKNGMPQTPPKPTAGNNFPQIKCRIFSFFDNFIGDQENVNPKVAVEVSFSFSSGSKKITTVLGKSENEEKVEAILFVRTKENDRFNEMRGL